MGTATLAGMALIESGVPETDPSLNNIIRYVRANALAQTRTYEVSLAIMFLDRLGHQADRPIIQMLGVRLLAGQGESGGWSYDCGYPLGAEVEARLTRQFSAESKLVSAPIKKETPKPEPTKNGPIVPRPDLPPEPKSALPSEPKPAPPKKDDPPAAVKPADEKPVMHPEALHFAKLINLDAQKNGRGALSDGDNSNTQFATLGLWCARKHGLPCEKALALLGPLPRQPGDRRRLGVQLPEGRRGLDRGHDLRRLDRAGGRARLSSGRPEKQNRCAGASQSAKREAQEGRR